MMRRELTSAFALAAMLGAAACGGAEEPEVDAATVTVDPAVTSGTAGATDPTMAGGTEGVLPATDTTGVGPPGTVPAAGPGLDAATAGGPVGTTSGSSTYGPQGQMPPGNPQPSTP